MTATVEAPATPQALAESARLAAELAALKTNQARVSRLAFGAQP